MVTAIPADLGLFFGGLPFWIVRDFPKEKPLTKTTQSHI